MQQPTRIGFTLVEVIVTVGIFAILAVAMLGTFTALTKNIKAARERAIVSNLAANYLEIVRNMPFSQVGTVNGNPNGTLPDLTNAFTQQMGGVTYQIYYIVTYLDDSADGTIVAGTDAAPNDYKQVKMDVKNTATGHITSYVTNVVPPGLEGISNAGALVLNVFNAAGVPVPGANLHITYPASNPTIILDRTSDSTGQWVEVGLPAVVNSYRVVVTKSGYSSDQTYPITVPNPNPAKPDATVVNGKVTQVSFFIDLVSNLTIKTLNQFCQNINGVNLNVAGAKLIGTNPNVLKFNQNYASSSGQIALSSIEWDTYTPTLLTGQSYIVRGTSPIQKIDILPNTTQTFTMILDTNTTSNSLLVIVKEAASGAALEGAAVHLHKGGSSPADYYATTGGSVWVQSSWTGGGGQANWSATNKYFSDDGNIDVSTLPTGVRLKKVSSKYVASGQLDSSSFDTGTSLTNYTILTWQPTSQDPATTLKFQVAVNNDNATWNYVGPDGTSSTYFTTPGVDMGSALDNNRYVRYRVYLSTTNNTKTPVLTSMNVNFVTGCFTPGQSLFPGLAASSSYSLDVSLAGYQTQTVSSLNINGNQVLEILLSP